MNAQEPTISAHGDSTLSRVDDASAHGAALRNSFKQQDVAAMLAAHPDFRSNKSLVINWAEDEYLALLATDASLTPSKYVERFADFGSSLKSAIHRQLELDDFIAERVTVDNGSRGVPATLGSFRVIEELGHGALGTVYLCKQMNLSERQVVVKTGREIMFEARSLGRLAHPNIVPIYSVERDESSGANLLCMPFLGRSTLCDVVDLAFDGGVPTSGAVILKAASVWHQSPDRMAPAATAPFPLPMASYVDCVTLISARIADGLAHAHAQGILHGDLKPSNILLSPTGQPLVVDFNLSGNSEACAPARGGTLPYMPPEQLVGIANNDVDAGFYDERSDLYSLGAVIYELLSGRPPFQTRGAATIADAATQVRELQRRGCRPLNQINPNIQGSLSHLIGRCLSFDRAKRVGSASQLRDELLHELRPWALFGRGLFARRKAIAAGLVCLSVVGSGLGVYASTRPTKEAVLLKEGVDLRNAGQLAQAEAALRKGLESRPDDANLNFELARTALARNDLTMASDVFHTLARDGRSPVYAAYLAYCQSRQGNLAAAIPWYQRARELGDDSGEIHNNLAVVYGIYRTQKSAEEQAQMAESELSLALDRLPTNPTVQLNYCIHAIAEAGKHGKPMSERAVKFSRDLCARHPNSAALLLLRARVIAIAAAGSPELTAEGIQALKSAYQLGAGPPLSRLQGEPIWDSFRLRPEFEAVTLLATRSNRGNQALPIARLLQPLP